MDVQATAATATILPPASAQVASGSAGAPAPSIVNSAHAGAVAAVAGAPAGTSVVTSPSGSGDSGSSSNSTIGAHPGLATLPAGPVDGAKKGGAADTTLTKEVAQLFNVQEQNISVSFRVETNPNEIVTVFTDKTTGKVIVQFPSETLIALAKAYDKLGGNVVNKKV